MCISMLQLEGLGTCSPRYFQTFEAKRLLQIRLARLVVFLEKPESCLKENSEEFFHCLQPSRKFEHVTCVLRGLVWVSTE